MQTSYGPAQVRQDLKILVKQKLVVKFKAVKETHAKPCFQELNSLNKYQINLPQVLIFMQGSNVQHPLGNSPSSFNLLTMYMKPNFLNTI